MPNLEMVLVTVMMDIQPQLWWLLLRVLLVLWVAATASSWVHWQPRQLLLLIICLRYLWLCCTVHLLHQPVFMCRQHWMISSCHITEAALPAVYGLELWRDKACMLLVRRDAAHKAGKVIQPLQ